MMLIRGKKHNYHLVGELFLPVLIGIKKNHVAGSTGDIYRK